MKKLISLLLVAVLALTLAAPAFAAGNSDYRGKVPVILISGDGDPIVDADGNIVFTSEDFYNSLNTHGGTDRSTLLEAAQNVLLPLLLEGVLQDKWDNYYDAFYKEISDLFSEVMLDENGNVTNGTDISKAHREENAKAMKTDRRDKEGTYAFNSYHFWYDWRLDPLQTADELNEYIEAVCSVTGHDKVCVVTRCVGHSVLLSYIAKYGTARLYGVGVDGTTSNGSEFISGALSGDFSIEGDSIARFIEDSDAFDVFHVDSLVGSTLQLLETTGVLDKMTNAAKRLIYLKIEKGVVSAIARATVFTMPCYWALVSEDKYEKAKEYVFGKEGSEKRAQYAGLIKKIDNYDVTVRQHISELMSSVPESGGNICVISKYGAQIVPIIRDADYISDQYASVSRSSFGATTSKIGETLSDKYIEERTEAGFGKYISPDRQIDASTCLFPDHTYFVKGVKHSDWSKVENNIFMTALQAETPITVDELTDKNSGLKFTQFIVAHPDSNDWEPMNEENCNTENWSDESSAGAPTTKAEKLSLFISSLLKWLKLFFEKIISLIQK